VTTATTPPAEELRQAADRHLISNALARYAAAMDGQDPVAAGRLLAQAQLHFKDHPVRSGQEEITGFYAAVFPNPSRTRHLVSNVIVTDEEACVSYEALYQRWSVTDPTAPRCEAIGRYTGRFTRSSSGLIWTEHRVLAG
jgi:hypothetical protein